MAVPTYTAAGAKATTAVTLEKTIFDVEVKNHDLLKQAYVAYQANGRENLAKTLKRGEVRGGGRKPWKQKGTGRARFGSIRVPIWRGGGITFGPLGKENYTRNITKKAKQQAVRHALTVNQEIISVVESFESKDGKTAQMAALLTKLGATRRTLIVTDNKDANTERSVSNLKNIKLVHAMYLNVFDIMNADSIIITKKSLPLIETWLKKEQRYVAPAEANTEDVKATVKKRTTKKTTAKKAVATKDTKEAK
jgi:large subunit ribosomal protein L4